SAPVGHLRARDTADRHHHRVKDTADHHHRKVKDLAERPHLKVRDTVGRHPVKAESLGPGGAELKWVAASDGHIPPNPVQGGIEDDGKPLFVARAIYKGGLHPGKAGQHLGGGGCAIGYGGKEVGVSEYQVLCGDASKLRWSAQDGILNLEDCVPYPAGHEESGEPLYIAKTLHDGSQQLGKCAMHLKRGMSFPYGRKEVLAEKYMILCYADAKTAPQ
ncbi:hypothetical protein H4S07_007184, partial [Coemansia furcata]